MPVVANEREPGVEDDVDEHEDGVCTMPRDEITRPSSETKEPSRSCVKEGSFSRPS